MIKLSKNSLCIDTITMGKIVLNFYFKKYESDSSCIYKVFEYSNNFTALVVRKYNEKYNQDVFNLLNERKKFIRLNSKEHQSLNYIFEKLFNNLYLSKENFDYDFECKILKEIDFFTCLIANDDDLYLDFLRLLNCENIYAKELSLQVQTYRLIKKMENSND